MSLDKIAGADRLGLIKIGAGLSVDTDGVASTTTPAIPVATPTTTGIVKIGSGLSVETDGTIKTIGEIVTTDSLASSIDLKGGVTLSVGSTVGATTLLRVPTGLPIGTDIWVVNDLNSDATISFQAGVTITKFGTTANYGSADTIVIPPKYQWRAVSTGSNKFYEIMPVQPVTSGVLPKLNVTSPVSGQHLAQVAMYTSGTGHNDAPLSGTADSFYLQLGGHEFGTGSSRAIGFGYVNDFPVNMPPASIYYNETLNSGATKGDIVIAARDTTGAADIPVERLRVTSAGDIVTPSTYTPAGNQSLVTKKYVDTAVSSFASTTTVDPTQPVSPGTVLCNTAASVTFGSAVTGQTMTVINSTGGLIVLNASGTDTIKKPGVTAPTVVSNLAAGLTYQFTYIYDTWWQTS